jgi:hypothetical protein
MTTVITALTDRFTNKSTGYKEMRLSVSCVNPYTAGGEAIDLSTYFKTRFEGGWITAVQQSVGIDLAGIVSSGTFRGDTSSYASAVLQFYANGLGGTSKAGLRVDNTTANISTATVYAQVVGY